MIPDMIKKPCRQSPYQRKSAAIEREPCVSPKAGTIFKHLKAQHSQKEKKQQKSDPPKLAKDLQKDLVGMDHGLGPLDGIRKIMLGKALISQSDAPGVIKDHPQAPLPNE